jgi:hypothetical protein
MIAATAARRAAVSVRASGAPVSHEQIMHVVGVLFLDARRQAVGSEIRLATELIDPLGNGAHVLLLLLAMLREF